MWVNKEEYEGMNKELTELQEKLEAYRDLKYNGYTLGQWISERLETAEKVKGLKFERDLLDKEIELKRKYDGEQLTLRNEVHSLQVKHADLKARNEMLERAVELGSEIIDIKDLVGKLVAKMPEVKLDKLAVTVEQSKGK